ncbi:MAG: LemA family protein [Planctomycetota bacterium]
MDPALIAAIVAFLVVAFAFLAIYNTLVRLRNLVADSWSGVETELKRRHDLIPNLVSAVRGYMKFEQQVLENVTKLRSQLASSNSDPKERGYAESELSRGLKSLFAVVENYPELKANANVMTLQQELVRTEDRIQAARRFYNGNVRDYNTRCETIPSNIIASMFGFKKCQFFEIESSTEREVPQTEL